MKTSAECVVTSLWLGTLFRMFRNHLKVPDRLWAREGGGVCRQSLAKSLGRVIVLDEQNLLLIEEVILQSYNRSHGTRTLLYGTFQETRKGDAQSSKGNSRVEPI